ncbi:MAG TPA: GNAT family N-acetyltransferase [Clostridia bacterium]|nr:GNAT family N-acetyltransferase [Clostridia bacterium]
MIYRKAVLADIDELVEIRQEMRLGRDTGTMAVDPAVFRRLTYDYFNKHLSDDSYISWIACDEDRIVATSGLCFYYAPPTYRNLSGTTAYIMNVYTRPEYRKRGIATKLMEYIVQEAKCRGCSKITLNASDMGRPLYGKLGFKDVHEAMTLYIQ